MTLETLFRAGCRSGDETRRWCAHKHRRNRHGDERHDVDHNDGRQTAESDGNSAKRCTHQSGQRRSGRVRRIGLHQLRFGYHSGNQRKRGWIIDLLEDRLSRGYHERGPKPIAVHRQQRQQGHGLQQIGCDDRAPQVPTIGKAATVRSKEHPDDQLDKEHRRGISP